MFRGFLKEVKDQNRDFECKSLCAGGGVLVKIHEIRLQFNKENLYPAVRVEVILRVKGLSEISIRVVMEVTE